MFQRLFLFLLPVLLYSCASYQQQAAAYYSEVKEGDYSKADRLLEKNRLLRKKRNETLYLLEKGKLCHLRQQWDSSNTYFNLADARMEDARTSVGDVAAGTLLNPMMQQYRPEAFERYLVHYYKSLNYLRLGLADEALVEARRITLTTQAQDDKVGNRDKYAEDAFSLMLQGIIYEKSNDINNAFIAYRNAVNAYLADKGKYGTALPAQLQQDLLRLAEANGFRDEKEFYEKQFNTVYTPSPVSEGGELILFWENGAAPVKAQEDIFFTAVKGDGDDLFFRDSRGIYNIPFDNRSSYRSNAKLEDLRSFRVALPRYETQPPVYSGATLNANGATFTFALAENINELAFVTLRERMLRELSGTLTRLAIRKLAEAAARPPDRKDDKNKTEEQKKKEKKKDNQREAIALGMQLFSLAAEKADTRNWQSLPHSIYYTRIPLQKGDNKLELTLQGNRTRTITMNVTGSGGLVVRNICTID